MGDTLDRYESRRYDIERPILTPAELYFQVNEVFGLLNEGRSAKIAAQPQCVFPRASVIRYR